MTNLRPGTLIEGRFRITRTLGSGAMGQVFLVEDLHTSSLRALKIAHSSRLTCVENIKRFERELQVCSAISHPNLVKFHDFGKVNDSLFYTMEFISGPTLYSLLDKQSFAEEETAIVAKQICGALGALHDAGVIHRDLKPENIIFREYPSSSFSVVLTDFGLAKNPTETAVTETGFTLGTPGYMSPEQIRCNPLTCQTDLFSLGIIIYEMLLGFHPFQGERIGTVLASILSDPPKAIPSELSRWKPFIDASLAKECKGRAKSAEELLQLIPNNETKSVTINEKKDWANYRSIRVWTITLLIVVLSYSYLAWDETPVFNYDVEKLTVAPKSNSVEVKWKSSREYPSQIAVLSIDSQVLVTGSEIAERTHSLVMSGLRPNEEYKLQVIYPTGATSLAKCFRTLPSSSDVLMMKIRKTINELRSFDGPAVSRDAVLQMLAHTNSIEHSLSRLESGGSQKSNRSAIAAATLSKSLRETKVASIWQQVRKLSPQVLSQGQIPFALECDFYRSISPVLDIYWLSCHFHVPLKEIEPPTMGDWSLRLSQRVGEVFVLPLTAWSKPRLLIAGGSLGKSSKTVETPFVVKADCLNRAKAAELVIELDYFRRALLKVSINGLPTISICVNKDALGKKMSNKFTIYQSFPLEALRFGHNQLVLRSSPLVGFAVADDIKVHGVSLRLIEV